jgi:acyl-CoA thioester hydrolase
MARTKLDPPEHLGVRTELPVPITDVNYGSDFANNSVLSLIHETRTLMLKPNGFPEGDVGGVGIIMVNAAVLYM